MDFFKYFEASAKKNIHFHEIIDDLINNLESNESINELIDFILDPQYKETLKEENLNVDSGSSIKKITLDYSPEENKLFIFDYETRLVDPALSVHNENTKFLSGLSVNFQRDYYSNITKQTMIKNIQYSLENNDYYVWGLNNPFTDEESFVSFITFSNKYPDFFKGTIYSNIFNGFFSFLLTHCQNDFYKTRIIDVKGISTNEILDFLYANRNIITHGRDLEVSEMYRESQLPSGQFGLYARQNIAYIFAELINRLDKQDLQNEKLVNWLIKKINQTLSLDDRNYINTLFELLQTVPEFKKALQIIKNRTSANIELDVGIILDSLDVIYKIYKLTGLEFYSQNNRTMSIYITLNDNPDETKAKLKNFKDIIENKDYLNIPSFNFYLADNDSKYLPLIIS